MRTTLTIEDDVVVRLEQLQKRTGDSFKAVVNSVLRAGIQQLAAPRNTPAKQRRYTHPTSLGKSRVGAIVSISEALAIAEGEAHT